MYIWLFWTPISGQSGWVHAMGCDFDIGSVWDKMNITSAQAGPSSQLQRLQMPRQTYHHSSNPMYGPTQTGLILPSQPIAWTHPDKPDMGAWKGQIYLVQNHHNCHSSLISLGTITL